MKRLARSRERIAVKGRGRSSRYEKTCCEKDEEKCRESMDSRVSNSARQGGIVDGCIIFTLERQRQNVQSKRPQNVISATRNRSLNYTERLANLMFCVRRHLMITQVGTSHYLHTSSYSGCEFCSPQKSHSGRKEDIEVRISAGISQSVELYIPFTPLLISFFPHPLQSPASNP